MLNVVLLVIVLTIIDVEYPIWSATGILINDLMMGFNHITCLSMT